MNSLESSHIVCVMSVVLENYSVIVIIAASVAGT